MKDDVVYFTAGRSSYLDGGIHVYSADPIRGKVLSHECIYSPDPKTAMQPPQSGPQEMPGALADSAQLRHKLPERLIQGLTKSVPRSSRA